MDGPKLPALAVTLALAACGAPAIRAPTAAVQSKPASTLKALHVTDHPPAVWHSLVADERIVRRPDLDKLCDTEHSAFFMPMSTAELTTPTVPPAALGCALPAEPADPSERIAENPRNFLGTPYCCPRGRTAALPHTARGLSCEQAVLEYARRAPVVDAEEANAGPFAHILNRGSYFEHCGVPDSMEIDICVAVLEGHAAGVSVRTSPASAEYAECVAESVSRLRFPSNPRMDVARTKY